MSQLICSDNRRISYQATEASRGQHHYSNFHFFKLIIPKKSLYYAHVLVCMPAKDSTVSGSSVQSQKLTVQREQSAVVPASSVNFTCHCAALIPSEPRSRSLSPAVICCTP